MPRKKRLRIIQNPPSVKGFNPFGYYGNPKNSIEIHYEEYEAIRLLDYEGLNQEEAAEKMDISRPTLTRIYESARKKVATALSEARQLVIEGGQAYFKDNWYECKTCFSRFNIPERINNTNCPVCNNSNTISFNQQANQ